MQDERGQILDEAKRIVSQDRNVEYGTPEDNFGRIAVMWGAYLNQDIRRHDVAAMMIMLKLARIGQSPHVMDHWVDIAGYAACGGEVRPQEDVDP
jgi:hypothetical protein